MTPTSQLESILASAQSRRFWLDNMALSRADTWALVTAMRHCLEMEQLMDGVTIDLEARAAYDGWCCCTWLAVYQDTRTRYRERVRSWDTDRRLTVTQEDEWSGSL